MTQPRRPYVIDPNPLCPAYDRLYGWRAVLNRWLGIEFKRARYVFFGPDQRLICAPETVPVVKRWLESRGVPYVIEPRLAAVPRDEAGK